MRIMCVYVCGEIKGWLADLWIGKYWIFKKTLKVHKIYQIVASNLVLNPVGLIMRQFSIILPL